MSMNATKQQRNPKSENEHASKTSNTSWVKDPKASRTRTDLTKDCNTVVLMVPSTTQAKTSTHTHTHTKTHPTGKDANARKAGRRKQRTPAGHRSTRTKGHKSRLSNSQAEDSAAMTLLTMGSIVDLYSMPQLTSVVVSRRRSAGRQTRTAATEHSFRKMCLHWGCRWICICRPSTLVLLLAIESEASHCAHVASTTEVRGLVFPCRGSASGSLHSFVEGTRCRRNSRCELISRLTYLRRFCTASARWHRSTSCNIGDHIKAFRDP